MNQTTQQTDKTAQADDSAGLESESMSTRNAAHTALATELYDLIRKDAGNTPDSLQDDVRQLAYDDVIAAVELYAAGHPKTETLTAVREDLIALRDLVKEFSRETRQHAVAHIPHVDFLQKCAELAEATAQSGDNLQLKMMGKAMERSLAMTQQEPNSALYNEQVDLLLDFKEEAGTQAEQLDFDSAIATLDELKTQAATLETQRVDIRTANDEALRTLQGIIEKDLEG